MEDLTQTTVESFTIRPDAKDYVGKLVDAINDNAKIAPAPKMTADPTADPETAPAQGNVGETLALATRNRMAFVFPIELSSVFRASSTLVQ